MFESTHAFVPGGANVGLCVPSSDEPIHVESNSDADINQYALYVLVLLDKGYL